MHARHEGSAALLGLFSYRSMADPVRYEDLPTAYVFNASMSKQTLQVTHLPLQQALHSQLHQSLSTAVGSTNQASVAELNDTHRHAHAAVIYQTSNEAAAGRGHLTVSKGHVFSLLHTNCTYHVLQLEMQRCSCYTTTSMHLNSHSFCLAMHCSNVQAARHSLTKLHGMLLKVIVP